MNKDFRHKTRVQWWRKGEGALSPLVRASSAAPLVRAAVGIVNSTSGCKHDRVKPKSVYGNQSWILTRPKKNTHITESTMIWPYSQSNVSHRGFAFLAAGRGCEKREAGLF